MSEFFNALPGAFDAFWRFIEGFYGIAVTIGSIVLGAAFLLVAKILRESHGWLSSVFGMMGVTVAAFWAFGVLPSAWVYFIDASREALAGRVIPEAITPVAANFYEVFRDVVVVVETGVAVGVFAGAAVLVQKRYPRGLAEGEEGRPQSGGYK